ncbi:YfiR family protein [Caldimonas tepidiphila]|uniref:YfiR family protein n=1 Tax=Caldimonas tepidiphila TaxID=2315841 RepID=UPI000E5BBC77|nr:YfiR family protein [Caldimonas tepidiphila]
MKNVLSRTALALVLPLLACLPAAGSPAGEAVLKAQVLQRVLLFVKWPPKLLASGQALELCLLDETPLAAALGAPGNRPPPGLALRTRSVSLDELGGCHALYLGGQTAAMATLPRRPGLLLIGDTQGLLERGVMLNLLTEQGQVAFDVGLQAARAAGLEISPQLLRLARRVKDA